MQNLNLNEYFLPYQKRWLNDNSKMKIWEKSRRIGATYVQSYEDVRDCVAKKVPKVWFSSTDESAAREYIEYCEQWTELFDKAAKSLGNVVIDSEQNLKALVIEFSNGTKIHALTSNPKQFRSKEGKVVLDEYAHHNNPDQLWMAAKPCITWGYPLRILSTHNGQSCKFYKFVENAKQKKTKWSLHTTSIQLAVEEGLLDKISGRPTTEEEKQEWLEEQRISCFDDYTWFQEFCCQAMDESVSFLPYELIFSCEMETDKLIKPLKDVVGDLYVGMDIGRKEHLSVIWVIERLEDIKYTRQVIELPNTLFRKQKEVLYEILRHEKLRRCCIDASGLGMELAENAVIDFSPTRVEAVSFTPKVKEELAFTVKINFDDRRVFIPSEREIREDLHSVKKDVTTSGNIRFDVEKSEASGHADRFWALALALHAVHSYKGEISVTSANTWETLKIAEDYCEDIDMDAY